LVSLDVLKEFCGDNNSYGYPSDPPHPSTLVGEKSVELHPPPSWLVEQGSNHYSCASGQSLDKTQECNPSVIVQTRLAGGDKGGGAPPRPFILKEREVETNVITPQSAVNENQEGER